MSHYIIIEEMARWLLDPKKGRARRKQILGNDTRLGYNKAIFMLMGSIDYQLQKACKNPTMNDYRKWRELNALQFITFHSKSIEEEKREKLYMRMNKESYLNNYSEDILARVTATANEKEPKSWTDGPRASRVGPSTYIIDRG